MKLAEWSKTDLKTQRKLIIRWSKANRGCHSEIALRASFELKKQLAAISEVTNVRTGAGEEFYDAQTFSYCNLILLVCTLLPESAYLQGIPSRFSGFAVHQVHLGDKSAAILKTWKKLFFELKGWDEEKTLKWAAKWADSLSGREDRFLYDKGPIRTAASAIMSETMADALTPDERCGLCPRIVTAIIGRMPSKSPLQWHPDLAEDYDWSYARQRINQLILEAVIASKGKKTILNGGYKFTAIPLWRKTEL